MDPVNFFYSLCFLCKKHFIVSNIMEDAYHGLTSTNSFINAFSMIFFTISQYFIQSFVDTGQNDKKP